MGKEKKQDTIYDQHNIVISGVQKNIALKLNYLHVHALILAYLFYYTFKVLPV